MQHYAFSQKSPDLVETLRTCSKISISHHSKSLYFFFLISKKIILKNTRTKTAQRIQRGEQKEKRKEKKKKNKNTRKTTKTNYKEDN